MLKVRIETNNAAFEDWREGQIAECLKHVSQEITNGLKEGNIYDSNGNPVGSYKLTNR